MVKVRQKAQQYNLKIFSPSKYLYPIRVIYVKVLKMNIDESPNSAQNYGVSSIPTLMVFKNGDVVERFVGIQPKARLQEALDEAKG